MTSRSHYTPATYTWHGSLGHHIATIKYNLRRRLEQELTRHDISGSQWVILMKAAHDEEVTAADLAKGLEYDPGAMTRILDRMEKKGVIRRVRAEQDRRRIFIELTPKGRKLVPVLQDAGIHVLNGALKGFSTQEFKQLNELLGRVADNVK